MLLIKFSVILVRRIEGTKINISNYYFYCVKFANKNQ